MYVGVVVGVTEVCVGVGVGVTRGTSTTIVGPPPVVLTTGSPSLLITVITNVVSPVVDVLSAGVLISTSPSSKVSVVPSSYIIVPVVFPELTTTITVSQLLPVESQITIV